MIAVAVLWAGFTTFSLTNTLGFASVTKSDSAASRFIRAELGKDAIASIAVYRADMATLRKRQGRYRPTGGTYKRLGREIRDIQTRIDSLRKGASLQIRF